MRIDPEYEGPCFEPIPRRRMMRVMMPDTAQAFGCNGKRKIPTAALARRAAHRGEDLAHYFCMVCHFWHTGNRTRIG